MTPAQEILHLVFTADPRLEFLLKKIDSLVYNYVRPNTTTFFSYPKYTRSRDVLKTIRPEGWYISSILYDRTVSAYEVCLGSRKHTQRVVAYGATEELAELHAIIQAIEFERTQKGEGNDHPND